MIYKNLEEVVSICKEINEHMEDLNELCKANAIQIQDTHNCNIFTIVVRPDYSDEYVFDGNALIEVIKDDLKRKIADLHVELEKL